MRSELIPALCILGFLVCEILVASLLALYIAYPCSWPLNRREACQPKELCPNPPCLRKCCPLGQELTKEPDEPATCSHTNSSMFNINDVPLSGNYSLFSMGLCPYRMYQLDDGTYFVLPDGSLSLSSSDTTITVPPQMFCLESFQGDSTKAYKCLPPPTANEMTNTQKLFYPLTLALSVPFLVATTAVYLILPKLRNLHGLCLLCHGSSLTVSCFLLALVQINIFNLNQDHRWACQVSAFVIQFSFLATFFWLNVMCFDIWWVFSGLRSLRGTQKEREHKKFILYSLYAWGSPLVILAITLVMEIAPFVPDSFIKPRFGVNKCWFKDWDALVLYFYLPIGVLILLNIVMFMTTAIRLRAHTRDTKVLKSGDSKSTHDNDRQRFNLYLKLFIVMGINWVMELVSFAVGGPKYIWFLTDIGNTLQGVLIFFIFVCKRKILRMLNQKLCPRWELVGPATSVRSTKTDKAETAKTDSK